MFTLCLPARLMTAGARRLDIIYSCFFLVCFSSNFICYKRASRALVLSSIWRKKKQWRRHFRWRAGHCAICFMLEYMLDDDYANSRETIVYIVSPPAHRNNYECVRTDIHFVCCVVLDDWRGSIETLDCVICEKIVSMRFFCWSCWVFVCVCVSDLTR